MKKIKVALVGTGRISARHISALVELEEQFEIVALCDINQDKLEACYHDLQSRYPSHFKGKLVVGYDNLLDAISTGVMDVDMISICTPSGYHEEQAIAGLRAGCNVCVEKPMALTESGCIRMVNESERCARRIFTVMQNRYNPTIQKLKRLVDSGMAGRIYMVNANILWCRPQAYYDQDNWRGTKKLDGGALMNQSIHYFDILQWLCGKESQLSAFVKTFERRIEAEDTGVVNIYWECDALSSIAATMLCNKANVEGSITVVAENGTAIVGGKALNNINFWSFEEDIVNDDKSSSDYEPVDVYGNGHSEYYTQIYDCIANGEDGDLAIGLDGSHSVRLVERSYLSSEIFFG